MSTEEQTVLPSTEEVKTEENAGAEANATAAAPPTPTGLSKQELDVCDGILKRISDYRDEEYVPFLKYYIPISCN